MDDAYLESTRLLRRLSEQDYMEKEKSCLYTTMDLTRVSVRIVPKRRFLEVRSKDCVFVSDLHSIRISSPTSANSIASVEKKRV